MDKSHRIIFVAFGSLGDVNPLLAIAKRLCRTHKVTFLANEYFGDYVRETGVDFFAIGTVEDQLGARESKSSNGETIEGRRLRFENIIGKSYKVAYDYFSEKIKNGEKLIVVTHGNLSPAVIACEVFHIPIIFTHYAPSQIPHNYEDSILCSSFYSGSSEWWLRHVRVPFEYMKKKFSFEVQEQLNAHRASFGLGPVASSWKHFLQKFKFKKENFVIPVMKTPLELVLAPYWFCEPIDIKNKNYKFCGFPFVEETFGEQERQLDEFITKFGPPIVFTPGTAVEDVDSMVNEIIPICRKLGSPGVFCSKLGKEAFEKLPMVDDVPLLFVEQAKFSHLLPKSRCLIHHGGVGTLAQAVRAGIPQIVRPRMYDQPSNGVRVMMFGLGGSVFQEAFHADAVANILVHIENSATHKEMLAYYSDAVRNEDGVGNCCKYIEEVIADEEKKYAKLDESIAAH